MTAVQKPLERSGMLEKSQLCCIQPTGGGAGEGAGRPVSNAGLVKAPRVWPSPWGSYTKEVSNCLCIGICPFSQDNLISS